MSGRDFDKAVEDHQVRWRAENIATQEHGMQNGKVRPWILPPALWEEGLWPQIRSGSDNSLPAYLAASGVQKHPGVHNLKSSWMLCANLYFPFQQDRAMLAGFLKERVCPLVEAVEAAELEYAEQPPLDPCSLLGEPQGTRGSNQTSPDVAFVVTTASGGKGLILTENKFTEHSFYGCSGRKKKYGNPDAGRCLDVSSLHADLPGRCYLLDWEQGRRANRKYWDYVRISDAGRRTLKRCPAATSGYQLFRQQALAEGIAQSGKYEFVVSCVAYDERNETLIQSLRATGIDDFRTGWAGAFDGEARFASFSHQQWVGWVRKHDAQRRWKDWLGYTETRYGL